METGVSVGESTHLYMGGNHENKVSGYGGKAVGTAIKEGTQEAGRTVKEGAVNTQDSI